MEKHNIWSHEAPLKCVWKMSGLFDLVNVTIIVDFIFFTFWVILL